MTVSLKTGCIIKAYGPGGGECALFPRFVCFTDYGIIAN
jgi:hypothetical protein